MTADLVWGARAIADFLRDECGIAGASPKMVYHWAERSVIPIATLNRKLVISRTAIFAYFNDAIAAAITRCGTAMRDAAECAGVAPLESGSPDAISPPSPAQSSIQPESRARGPRHRIR